MYQNPYLPFQYANVSHSQEPGVRNGRFTASVRRAGATDFLSFDATIDEFLSILFGQFWAIRFDTPAWGVRCELVSRSSIQKSTSFSSSLPAWKSGPWAIASGEYSRMFVRNVVKICTAKLCNCSSYNVGFRNIDSHWHQK